MPQRTPGKSVRLAHFRDDLIVLDLTENRFSLIPNMPVERINSFLASAGSTDATLSAALSQHGITNDKLPLSAVLSSLENTGLLETRWRTPFTPSVRYSLPLLCRSIWTLTMAGLIIKSGGYALVVKALRRNSQNICVTAIRSVGTDEIMAHINKVFIFDFSNNRCLTYSLTLYLMARRMGLPAKLMVGVRTRPFFSHAWVELDGVIINDDPELREKLSIILET